MSEIVISYDGNDITKDVAFSDASFTSMVNGQPGSCSFRVVDHHQGMSFVIGKKITVVVDGFKVWAGYLTSVGRVYGFADTYDRNGGTRFLLLRGSDVNILFKKRALHLDTNPRNMDGPLYPYPTADTTVIANLVNHWIDLDPEIDTTSRVVPVGNVNIGSEPFQGYGGANTWETAMSEIARSNGAVYYLTPEYELVYDDVDTATSAYGLSDTPEDGDEGDPGTVGYREFTILNDGSNLINDALIVGAGGGSATPVWARPIDSPSVSTHGLWQYAQNVMGVWKQDTVNKIASSIVYGSPASKRGAKDDRVSVELTTTHTGFLPGEKVQVYSRVYGWDDVVPIRKMEIGFPTPTDVMYRLTLSHEINQPFLGLIDPVSWIIPHPGTPVTPDLPPPIHTGDPGGCSDATCGITDTFNRPNGPAGTSDSGLVWSGGGVSAEQLATGTQSAGLSNQFPFPFFCSFDLVLLDQDDNGIDLTYQGNSSSGTINIITHVTGVTLPTSDIYYEVGVNGELQGGATGTITYPAASEIDINGTGMYVSIGGVVMSLNWTEVVGSSVTVVAVTSIAFWGQDET